MKLMFASDIHGSAFYCRRMLELYKNSGAKRLVLLGDILYHGPRNDLPREYAPKEVIAMLNPLKDELLAVRGNCDTEVDQMVLEFPILADYGLLLVGETRLYATHGHVYNENHLPPLTDGDALIHGHTHLLEAKEITAEDGRRIKILNPGSVSIPKGGNPATYALLEDGVFTILTLDGDVVRQISL
ncbi:phosphodiesterase [Enterocloster asparagiformis]|jgi:putative phosphoesterase|uniref:Phosphoesterase n=2 Tax=Enterocloster asparagiformis TaxID=333367 RepID=C0CWL5_9FIRM|nr:phosphodiesterase [Enterocloster asparagiformis]EEG56535.1 phosphodiesterase family protein [[Clostridium] asparagiforme DSM 15981]RGX30881.1 phosphodiesterase [Enterocloster asparagiformis]UWO75690.1 phosphodiesterase [[Clostridium] asparagiforme DSM 15981]